MTLNFWYIGYYPVTLRDSVSSVRTILKRNLQYEKSNQLNWVYSQLNNKLLSQFIWSDPLFLALAFDLQTHRFLHLGQV